jgi:hypothetical protein
MKNQPSGLYLGVVDFDDPTLLILGKPDSFLWFAAQISARRAFTLEGGPGESHASLRFVPTEGSGLLTRQGNAFEWQISALECKQVVEHLESLAARDDPRHAYLDPAFNEAGVQVTASINEWDASHIFG